MHVLVTYLFSRYGKCSFLNWKSEQIKRVVRSTLAAETWAQRDTANDGVSLAKINKIPIKIYTNCK